MGIFQKLKKNVLPEEDKKPKEEKKISSDKAVKKEAKPKESKKEETGIATLKSKERGSYTNAHKVLKSARVSEKAAGLGSQNKYVFLVDVKANKTEIKKAIHHVFGVTPMNVHVINVKGKKVGTRRGVGKRSDYRKAIVTLNKKDSISIYEGV